MIPDLIASPYPDGYVIVSPGLEGGITIGANRYAELRDATSGVLVPGWLATAALAQWSVDVTNQTVSRAVLVRPDTGYGYARASYELNLGCNYDCEHCYREHQIDLIAEGVDGLRKLAVIGDRLTTRHGGCSGCTLQKTCGTCMPLANLYRQANAPLDIYCQHGSGPLSPRARGGES